MITAPAEPGIAAGRSRPLPALTVEDLVSQLIWRAIGPTPWVRNRVDTVAAWAGLTGPAQTTQQIADEVGGICANTVKNWARHVAAQGVSVLLTWDQQQQLTRPTLPGEDHVARRRRATLFGVHEPARMVTPAFTALRWTRQASRAVAALGPLTLTQLHAGITRADRRRSHPPPTVNQIGLALTGTQILTPMPTGHRWGFRPGHTQPAAPGDAQIAAVMTRLGGTASWGQLQTIIAATGQHSAGGVLYRNPLLIPTRPRGPWLLLTRYPPTT